MAKLDDIPEAASPDHEAETFSDRPLYPPGAPALGTGENASRASDTSNGLEPATPTEAPDAAAELHSSKEVSTASPVPTPPAATPAVGTRRPLPVAIAAPPKAGPTQAAPDLAKDILEGLERLETVLLNTQTAIADALKSPGTPAQASPIRRSIRTAAWTGLAAAVLSSGLTYGAISYLAIGQEPVDPRVRGWADSWSYLWRASPDFRQCWTTYLNTRQPQQCRLFLGGPTAKGSGS